jgi:hypothetical protein
VELQLHSVEVGSAALPRISIITIPGWVSSLDKTMPADRTLQSPTAGRLVAGQFLSLIISVMLGFAHPAMLQKNAEAFTVAYPWSIARL